MKAIAPELRACTCLKVGVFSDVRCATLLERSGDPEGRRQATIGGRPASRIRVTPAACRAISEALRRDTVPCPGGGSSH